jgi:hypothetical protein
MRSARLLAALLALAPVLPPAAQARLTPGERVLRTQTVTGRFTGWETGDYVWARIAVPHRRDELRGMPGSSPIEFFLEANRGRDVTVEIATVRMNIPEAGGWTNLPRITAARNADGSAQQWWHSLSRAARDRARSAYDRAIGADRR